MANSKPEIKFTQIFINDEFRDSISGKIFPTINPSNGQTIAYIQEGDKADVDLAVAAAMKAFKRGSPWRTMDASGRGKLLNKLAHLVERDANHIASIESLDNGKAFRFACWDVATSVSYFRFYAGFSDKIHGRTVPVDGDFFAYTRLEPIGIVGQIFPWNFPFMLSCTNIAPALAAGNCVIVKPAEQTPLSILYFASLVKEAGFPPGVFNVVPGYGPTAGGALTEHMQVDMISFTGSLEVGKIIQVAAAKSNLKRVSLELGGKSPLVISQHCDLNEAVGIAQIACFFNHGQTCCAGTRIFVHESIHDSFVEASVRAAVARKLGDPFNSDTDQGPQIDQDQLEKVLEMIQSGINQGANLKCGGKRFGKKGFFVEPTIFTDVHDDMLIAKEEIFGPVMQLFKYRTIDEVIERANDTEYGLAAGIVTNDVNEATVFSHSVRAGTVWINNYFGGNFVHCPFGGYKQSGLGRAGGEEGIMEYVEVKTVTVKRPTETQLNLIEISPVVKILQINDLKSRGFKSILMGSRLTGFVNGCVRGHQK